MSRPAALLFLALAACAPSAEEVALSNAGRNMAYRIWEPQVADAIGLSGTFVIDFKPGADALARSVPMPLGMATYGKFDKFDLVMFDTSKATAAQVLAGMRVYCGKLGRPLRVHSNGVMERSGNGPVSGYVSGDCIG